MVRLFLADEHLNLLLSRFTELCLVYREGCLVGHFKLPLGGATAVAVPSCRAGRVVLSVPFQQIKGDITGGFLLARLTNAFWGFISDTILSQAAMTLAELGLASDTIQVGKERSHEGEVGLITVSLERVNQWLGGQPVPGVVPAITGAEFERGGVALTLSLAPRLEVQRPCATTRDLRGGLGR